MNIFPHKLPARRPARQLYSWPRGPTAVPRDRRAAWFARSAGETAASRNSGSCSCAPPMLAADVQPQRGQTDEVANGVQGDHSAASAGSVSQGRSPDPAALAWAIARSSLVSSGTSRRSARAISCGQRLIGIAFRSFQLWMVESGHWHSVLILAAPPNRRMMSSTADFIRPIFMKFSEIVKRNPRKRS